MAANDHVPDLRVHHDRNARGDERGAYESAHAPTQEEFAQRHVRVSVCYRRGSFVRFTSSQRFDRTRANRLSIRMRFAPFS